MADIVLGVERDDRITILGCATEQLNIVDLEEGYGIEAQGLLEAIILDSKASMSDIQGMVNGDSTRWF